jgi:hypothetical protein
MTVWLAASGMGLLLWVVNIVVVAPSFIPWFVETHPVVEITARVLFFGLPLGVALTGTLLSPSAPTQAASSLARRGQPAPRQWQTVIQGQPCCVSPSASDRRTGRDRRPGRHNGARFHGGSV